jgi:hypothetical protein
MLGRIVCKVRVNVCLNQRRILILIFRGVACSLKSVDFKVKKVDLHWQQLLPAWLSWWLIEFEFGT